MKPIPLIIGSNSYEGAFLYTPSQLLTILGNLPDRLTALYPKGGKGDTVLRMMFTDTMGADCRWVAAENAKQAPTYLYRFSYVPEAMRSTLPGAPHGSELPFVFGSWNRASPAMLRLLVGTKSGPTQKDLAIRAFVHGCWLAFAKAGKPECHGVPRWPRYSRKADELMNFDTVPEAGARVRAAQYDAIEEALPGFTSSN